MRSPLDRLRQAVLFEVVALILVIPLGALAFGMPMHDAGVVGVAGASIATVWNLVYNHAFDVALRRLTGTARKSPAARVVHALLFEGGLLVVLMPFIAWYLEVSLWRALVMDVSLAAFYVVYAFVFTWLYDLLFPLPEWTPPAS